jgi:hypothetical protein
MKNVFHAQREFPDEVPSHRTIRASAPAALAMPSAPFSLDLPFQHSWLFMAGNLDRREVIIRVHLLDLSLSVTCPIEASRREGRGS